MVENKTPEKILSRAAINPNEIDSLVNYWQYFLDRIELKIADDPPLKLVLETKKKYLALMRHLADIPVLASAIDVRADLILSGNRKHFNDATSKKCGMPFYSCQEFLQNLTLSS